MKKIVSMFLAVMMIATLLVGCGGKKTSGSDAASSDFKVGAIYINSQSDTAGYTFANHQGNGQAWPVQREPLHRR